MDVEQNHTEMLAANSNYKLATTGTTSHAGTLYDNITLGNHCMYCSGISDPCGIETAAGVSSSRCLNFTTKEKIKIKKIKTQKKIMVKMIILGSKRTDVNIRFLRT